MPSDREVQWFGTNTDIEELKRAQSAQELLAAIVESTDDAILSTSVDGTVLSWNAGAQRLLGYRPEEIIGKPSTTLVPPERVQEEKENLARLRRGERVERGTTFRVARDGRRIDVSVTVSPLNDSATAQIGGGFDDYSRHHRPQGAEEALVAAKCPPSRPRPPPSRPARPRTTSWRCSATSCARR